MITSLTLENWKSHSKSEFKFGKGINILVGRMGAGKSSVLDALCFALYGTFPKMSRRDQTTEHLVNIASAAPYSAVKLEFDKGGTKYTVERKIGKKLSDAEVSCNGKLVQKGPKAVTDYVVAALGVDYELFTRAIYSEQNRIDYLLSLNPRARKGEIDYLLGLGEFDTAREAATSAAGKLSEQAQSLSSEVDAAKITQAQQKIEELKTQASTKEKAIAGFRASIQALLAQLSEKQAQVAALEKLRAEWRLQQSECERQKGLVERLNKETAGKQKIAKEEQERLATTLRAIEETLAAAKAEGKKLQADLSALKSEIAVEESAKKSADARAKRKKEIEEKMAVLSGGKDSDALQKERDELKGDVDRLTEEHSWLHVQHEQLSSAIGALSSGTAKCPVCDSDLSDGKSQKIAGEKQAQLDNGVKLAGKLAEELAGKKLALSALETRISELRIFTKEMDRISSEGIDISGMQKSLDEKGAKKKLVETGVERNENEVKKAEKERESAKTTLEEVVRTAKLFEELETASSKLSSAEKKLAELKFDDKDYETARKQSEELKVSCAKSDAELKGEEKQQKLLAEMLALEQTALSLLSEKEKRAKKYADAASSMQIYKNSLALAQSELRSELVSEINQALVEIWPAVYPYSDYGGIKLEADEKDYRLLMQKEGWREVDAVASGGERACLCLALRIAFATVLTPDIGWLILDEPTHNLDTDAVLMLSEAINTKIPSIVEQTLVITHDIALGENGEGNVFRLERDKAKNESTRVETVS